MLKRHVQRVKLTSDPLTSQPEVLQLHNIRSAWSQKPSRLKVLSLILGMPLRTQRISMTRLRHRLAGFRRLCRVVLITYCTCRNPLPPRVNITERHVWAVPPHLLLQRSVSQIHEVMLHMKCSNLLSIFFTEGMEEFSEYLP